MSDNPIRIIDNGGGMDRPFDIMKDDLSTLEPKYECVACNVFLIKDDDYYHWKCPKCDLRAKITRK